MSASQKLPPNATPDLELAFDIGHSSIGWAVLQSAVNSQPKILGCGVVTFGADDCLASKRRDYRRQRRHARSTRHRIARMERLIESLKVLTPEQLAAKHRQGGGHPAPWLLAACVLASDGDSKFLLDWLKLWDVLRWYAHNRGYDGNSRWANVAGDALSPNEKEENRSDTEKEQNAIKLMDDYRKDTMAETVFAELFTRNLTLLIRPRLKSSRIFKSGSRQINAPFRAKRLKQKYCEFCKRTNPVMQDLSICSSPNNYPSKIASF
jgi:CRISPR/Cas system Type II protein with McrA/HNH and RuvC-like nuclease domain